MTPTLTESDRKNYFAAFSLLSQLHVEEFWYFQKAHLANAKFNRVRMYLIEQSGRIG